MQMVHGLQVAQEIAVDTGKEKKSTRVHRRLPAGKFSMQRQSDEALGEW